MKGRGLKGVRLFVSDKCLGLVESLPEFYPEAKWQRCVVHWYRNVFSAARAVAGGARRQLFRWNGTFLREAAAMLKAVHAQEDKAAARQKAAQVVEKLRERRLERAAKLVGEGVEETLSYMDFPEEHWIKLRTNNPLERIMKEIRRRTRSWGSVPLHG